MAAVSMLAVFGVVLSIENQYRNSNTVVDVYRDARIAIERMFREISETSNRTVTIIDDAISFASARDGDGVFHEESYGFLAYGRPVWQKAVIYYVYTSYDPVSGRNIPKLHRKEILKTNWSTNYDPVYAMDANGEVVARNIMGMDLDYSPAETLAQAHVLNISLVFMKDQDGIKAQLTPGMTLNTTIPIMNRDR
jgi:hypothetical protein